MNYQPTYADIRQTWKAWCKALMPNINDRVEWTHIEIDKRGRLYRFVGRTMYKVS